MIELFSDIKITKGYNRSLLQDLTKGTFELLSNETYAILSKLETYTDFEECLAQNKEQEAELSMLFSLNIFNPYADSIHKFPEIAETNESPYHFQAITFVLSPENESYLLNNLETIYTLTRNLYLEIDSINRPFLDQFSLKLANYKHIRIIFYVQPELIDELNAYLEDKDLFYDFLEDEKLERYAYLDTWPSLDSNWMTYIENKLVNSGFYEKFYIAGDGNIGINKYDEISIGNISDFNDKPDFLAIKEHPSYLSMINATSDKIAVCKDCEFRKMCSDAKVVKPTNQESPQFFKEECRYNPYISLWSHEEGYLNLKASGIAVTKDEFKIDVNRVNEINSLVWSD